MPGSAQSCVPVYACIGGEDLFVGRSVGWEQASLTGTLSTGATCNGTVTATRTGGQATFRCSDGQSANLNFALAGDRTSTALAIGRTNQDREIRGWSGPALRDYFARGGGGAILICGATTVAVE